MFSAIQSSRRSSVRPRTGLATGCPLPSLVLVPGTDIEIGLDATYLLDHTIQAVHHIVVRGIGLLLQASPDGTEDPPQRREPRSHLIGDFRIDWNQLDFSHGRVPRTSPLRAAQRAQPASTSVRG